MITFITNRIHQVEPHVDLQIFNDKVGLKMLNEYMKQVIISDQCVAFDTEASDLDAYKAVPLLLAIGDTTERFVVDLTSVDVKEFLTCWASHPTLKWLCHNGKYDYKLIKAHYGISILNLWDTMIAEQSFTKNMKYRYGLDKVVERRLQTINAFNKEERNEFVGMTAKSVFTTKQIRYTQNDLIYLKPLKAKLETKLKQYGNEWFVYNVEFPLICELGEAELEGWILNTKKWKENIKVNEDVKFESELSMDEYVRLKRKDLPVEEKIHLIGGKYDRPRIRQVPAPQVDLFGNEIPFEHTYKGKSKHVPKYVPNKGNINYKSPTEVIKLLGRLKYRVPTDTGNAFYPTFDKKGKVIPPYDGKFSTKKDVIEAFLLSNYGCPETDFYNLLRKHRVADKRINSFGYNFLDKINPHTGKIHSIYRQSFADNNRLQSGGGKNEPDKINNQNIPTPPEYRECFGVEEGYQVVTCDLSGAEVIVMADKANDKRLLELQNSDIHSHMAQTGWRNIFLYRAGLMAGLWADSKAFFKAKDRKITHEKLASYEGSTSVNGQKIFKYYQDSTSFIVSKKINTESHRKPCKNLTFGSVYGCRPAKAGRTINVSQEEGRIYIETIKSEISATFRSVEDAVNLAFEQGYLIINGRSKNRVWFPDILHELMAGRKPNKFDLHECDGQARNIPISGTQADMVKEAMVVIGQAIRKNKWDCKLLCQVHDELVYKWPIDMPAVKFISDTGEEKDVLFDEYVALTMTEVANRYLKHMKMKADYHTALTWTK